MNLFDFCLQYKCTVKHETYSATGCYIFTFTYKGRTMKHLISEKALHRADNDILEINMLNKVKNELISDKVVYETRESKVCSMHEFESKYNCRVTQRTCDYTGDIIYDFGFTRDRYAIRHIMKLDDLLTISQGALAEQMLKAVEQAYLSRVVE